MKTSKLFTIDVEIAEKLKNTNASELVNRLLKAELEFRSGKSTLLDEKKAEMKSFLKKKRDYRKKLRLLSRWMSVGWTISRRYGLKVALKNRQYWKYQPILTGERLRFLLPLSFVLGKSFVNAPRYSNE